MTPKNISILIISAIAAILIFIGIKWWSDQKEADKRQEIAKYDGIVEQLTKQLASKDSVAKRQKATIDSAFAKLNEKDTIVPRIHYDANLKKVKALGVGSSISFLSKRIN